MSQASSFDPITEIMLETFRLNGRLLAAGDAMIADLGLTSARWQVLGAIEMAGRPVTVSDIARTMGLTRQAVQRTVNVLAEEGRLEARDNPAHRRAPLIMTTPAGKAAYVQAIERQDQWTERLAPHFSENDLQRTLATLRRLRELADGSEG